MKMADLLFTSTATMNKRISYNFKVNSTCTVFLDNRPRGPRQDRGVKFGGSQIDNLSSEERRNRKNREDREPKGDQERPFPPTGEFR